ncbi:MAG: hypothetical protein KOO60_05650 [Gemmatimonadales bacterium]|nr:hypothetical protein [Gemmatimonadales bacterium]
MLNQPGNGGNHWFHLSGKSGEEQIPHSNTQKDSKTPKAPGNPDQATVLLYENIKGFPIPKKHIQQESQKTARNEGQNHILGQEKKDIQ